MVEVAIVEAVGMVYMGVVDMAVPATGPMAAITVLIMQLHILTITTTTQWFLSRIVLLVDVPRAVCVFRDLLGRIITTPAPPASVFLDEPSLGFV